MNSCEQTNDRIIDALTGNLDGAGREALERHLAACASCRAESEAMGVLWQAMAEAEVRPVERIGAPVIPTGQEKRFLWSRAAGLAAAVVIGLLGGYAAGVSRAPVPVPDDGRTSYLALLRQEGPALGGNTPPESALVKEYGAWAGELAADNRLISAERLNDFDLRFLGPNGRSGPEAQKLAPHISGFFLIRAGDFDDATRMVLGMPHLRYGGWIELRQSMP